MNKTKLKIGPLFFLLFWFAVFLPEDANSKIVRFQKDGISYRLEQYITTHYRKVRGDEDFGGVIPTTILNVI